MLVFLLFPADRSAEIQPAVIQILTWLEAVRPVLYSVMLCHLASEICETMQKFEGNTSWLDGFIRVSRTHLRYLKTRLLRPPRTDERSGWAKRHYLTSMIFIVGL